MENYENLFNKLAPDFLYHYTDVNAFQNIMKNGQLWASHIRFMNDYTEEFLALDKIIEILTKRAGSLDLDIEKLKKKIRKYFEEEISRKGIFILSFSEKADDLNQWRAYGNKIPSYCIKFNTQNLIQNLNHSFQKLSDIEEMKSFIRVDWDLNDRKRKFLLMPCIYESDEQEKLLEEVIEDSLSYVERTNDKIIESKLAQEIAKRLIIYAPIIKHRAFKYEQEWRIIIIYEKSIEPNFTKEDLKKQYEETDNDSEKERISYDEDCFVDNETRCNEDKKLLDFRIGRSVIVPYYKFSFDKDIVDEVIIGSCPDGNSVRESTVYFLSKIGFSYEKAKCMVQNTACPYRSW